jgi:hypothetical protein
MKPKGTICHLTSVHPRFDNRIFWKECCSLSKIFKVFLIVADGRGQQVYDNIEIIDIGHIRNRLKRIISSPFKILKLALKFRAKVYHIHDPELMIAGILLKLFRRKVIFDIHENVSLSLLTKEWVPKIFRLIISKLYRLF